MNFQKLSEEQAAEYFRPIFLLSWVLAFFISLIFALGASVIFIFFGRPTWQIFFLSIIVGAIPFVLYMRGAMRSIKKEEDKLVRCEDCGEVRNMSRIEEKQQKQICGSCCHEITRQPKGN